MSHSAIDLRVDRVAEGYFRNKRGDIGTGGGREQAAAVLHVAGRDPGGGVLLRRATAGEETPPHAGSGSRTPPLSSIFDADKSVDT